MIVYSQPNQESRQVLGILVWAELETELTFLLLEVGLLLLNFLEKNMLHLISGQVVNFKRLDTGKVFLYLKWEFLTSLLIGLIHVLNCPLSV